MIANCFKSTAQINTNTSVTALQLAQALVGPGATVLNPVITGAFGSYGTFIYLSQIYKNFKSLSDYPLDENEQLFILNILSKHYSDLNLRIGHRIKFKTNFIYQSLPAIYNHQAWQFVPKTHRSRDFKTSNGSAKPGPLL